MATVKLCKKLPCSLKEVCRKTNLNSGGGEIWDFKLDLDWRLALDDLPLDTGQAEVSSHEIFLASRE